jgi:hypothetical protein
MVAVHGRRGLHRDVYLTVPAPEERTEHSFDSTPRRVWREGVQGAASDIYVLRDTRV